MADGVISAELGRINAHATKNGQDPAPECREDGTRDHPLLAKLKSGAWLNAQTFPDLEWAIPGLLPEGLSLLVAAPKIGKTWLALDLGLAAASGGRALGSIPAGAPRPVLLLALEDSERRLQDHCGIVLNGNPVPDSFTYLIDVEPGMIFATIEAWLESQKESKPLVILDTLGKAMPPTGAGESSYQRDYRVAGRLQRITKQYPGMALLALHHDRKASSDDFVDAVSGTNGIAGAADTIMILSRPRNEQEARLKITGRDVNEAEYAIKFEGGRWTAIGDNLVEAAKRAGERRATYGLSHRSAELVRFVSEHSEGVRREEVAEHLGVDAATAGTYLKRLCDQGRIARPSRGLYTPVMSATSSHPDVANNRHNRGTAGQDREKPSEPGPETSACGDSGTQIPPVPAPVDHLGRPLCRTCCRNLITAASKQLGECSVCRQPQEQPWPS